MEKKIDKEQKNFHDGMTSAEGMEIQKQLPLRRKHYWAKRGRMMNHWYILGTGFFFFF